MPNVAGREFPYTPQGMRDAEMYRQSLGMRDGGPMGFRPLGYEVGGAVVMPNADLKQLILDLYQMGEVPEEVLRIAAKDMLTAEETALLQSYVAQAANRGTMPGMPMEPTPMGPMPGTTVVEGQFEEETGRPITEKRYDAQSYGGGPPGMAYGGIMGLSRKGR